VILTATIGEHEVLFRPPPTTADVLEWTVWIACMDDIAQQIQCAWQWAARWVQGEDAKTLSQKFGDVDSIVQLCSTIAQSAGVPEDIRTGLAELLDKQNGVNPDWKPKGVCGCSRCRRGIESNQPCMYDGVDPRLQIAAAAVIDTHDVDAPLYVNQIRAVLDAAENRRIRFERDTEEDKKRSLDLLRNHPLSSGGVH
jgi:hypothetical protein